MWLDIVWCDQLKACPERIALASNDLSPTTTCLAYWFSFLVDSRTDYNARASFLLSSYSDTDGKQ